MTPISSIALSGLQKASEKIAEAAKKISTGADIGNPEPIVDLLSAGLSFKANTKVIKADAEITDYLLNILA